MCLYVPDRKPLIAKEDITVFKIVRKEGELYVPYFEPSMANVIELDKELFNHVKTISVKTTCSPWPHNLVVAEGVFHTYCSSDTICRIEKEIERARSDVYVLLGTIPKGAKYFRGFTHSFTFTVEETYGSDRIIYYNPMPIDAFIKKWFS